MARCYLRCTPLSLNLPFVFAAHMSEGNTARNTTEDTTGNLNFFVSSFGGPWCIIPLTLSGVGDQNSTSKHTDNVNLEFF